MSGQRAGSGPAAQQRAHQQQFLRQLELQAEEKAEAERAEQRQRVVASLMEMEVHQQEAEAHRTAAARIQRELLQGGAERERLEQAVASAREELLGAEEGAGAAEREAQEER